MRVNSAFTGFFNNRWVRSGMAIVMLAIFFTASSFTHRSDRDLRSKQVNIIIRQIGDRLLLQAGDSTSRVLPVTETGEGTFLLKFENEFVFSHDSLIVLSQALLPKTEFPSGYTVTVLDCVKDDIVYGFTVSNNSPDRLACMGRREPSGCYVIEFIFPDFLENTEQKKADIDQPAEKIKSSKIDPPKANQKPEEIKTTTSDNDEQLTEQLKSLKVFPQEVNPELEDLKTKTFDYSLINLVYGVLVLLTLTLLIGRFKKVPAPQHQDYAGTKEAADELAVLGKFLFDVKGRRLLPTSIGMGNGEVNLTDKECKVLELLNKSFGELVPREMLMQKVWIDEGVITGRSLDMFVSKLRKKLSSDPALRITNVHGKGYKLEMPGSQIL